MSDKLENIKKELYKLINTEMNFQCEKIEKSEKDKKYWISFGKVVAFSKSIDIIENK